MERKPHIPIILPDTPESVKNTLYHWHMYKGDQFLAWDLEKEKFGRYFEDEKGKIFFDENAYSEEEIGEITTFEAEEKNIIENKR